MSLPNFILKLIETNREQMKQNLKNEMKHQIVDILEDVDAIAFDVLMMIMMI